MRQMNEVTEKIINDGSRSVIIKLIDRVLKWGDNLEAKAEGYLPFTPLNIAYKYLDKRVQTILDIGCGKGDPMLFINRHRKFYVVGVDVFSPYLDMCKRRGSHDELVQGDIRELTFAGKSFDAVLALRVLEHLTQEEGQELLGKMESIGRYQVILITPVEEFKQSKYDENEFQEHKSVWKPNQLKKMGYKVYLNGLKGIQKDSAHITRFQKIIAGFGHILWVLAGPVVVLFPSLGANMVAVKNLKELKR
jgi:ubiquinone/menaquinone biosynthesis C-methylase UbiE